MPRSTVSLHVRSLEKALGTRLFKRSTRSSSLTDDGQSLYDGAASGLDAIEAAVGLVRGGGALSGTIRIAAPADFPTGPLAEALTSFRSTHPRIRLDVTLSSASVDLIADNIDLAIRVSDRGSLDRIERPLMTVAWGFFASPARLERHGEPSSLLDLADFIAPAPSLASYLERCVLVNAALPSPAMETDNLLLARDLAANGAGVSLLPAGLCNEALRAGRLVRVLQGEALHPSPVAMTFPSRADLLPRVRMLADHLAQAFSDAAPQPDL